MKKKTFAAIALTSCIAFGATFTGCSLISTNNRLDMEQVIATVDISKSEKFDTGELKDYKSVVSSSEIIKRELISYFLNVGYSYVQNGSSYEETFNMLLNALIDNSVLVQYSTVELYKKATDENKAKFNNAKDEAEKYEALLDEDEINLATYKLYSSVNSAIDNFEKSVIEEEDGFKGTGTRSTPVNVNTEQDDYYPAKTENNEKVLDYGIYTGYGKYTLDNSGTYKDDALDGTTMATRVKAYNSFLNNLRRNNLVDGKTEAENLTDILALEYIKIEYVSQLESRIINKYYDMYEDEQEEKLLLNNDYINSVYEELLSAQTENYGKSTSAFESAMSSMSSTSFILYSPDTSDSDWTEFDENLNFAQFGFIYNILLPFNSRQSVQLNTLKSIQTDDSDDDYYYTQRNNLLRDIKTEDQRSAWFNGETDYSFEAEGNDFYKGNDTQQSYRNYLFFEDNLNNSGDDGRYKKLQAYEGKYSYNGKVFKNEDESYTLVPNKLNIDQMLAEFESYVNYVVGDGSVKFANNYTPSKENKDYYKTDTFKKSGNGEDNDDIDYSKFIYAEGKVDFGEFDNRNIMLPDSPQYKAMSAVNELQFAYTTDTSVLSNYIGYSLSAYDTSYIKEFEYAAKKAVAGGVGTFAVCAGDYGWHLIYVTNVFKAEGGAVYVPDWKNIEVEGTFENLFFEWIKGNDLSDVSTTIRTKILNDYNKDTTVTKYQSRYQDLLDLGK